MPFPVIPLPLAFTLPDIAGVPDVLGRVVPPQITAVISSSLASVYDTWLIQDEKKKWGFFIPPGDQSTMSSTIEKDENGNNVNVVTAKQAIIFESKPVLTSASVHSIELQESYAISTAPQEDGAFTSYNKVKLPTTGAVRLICDGFQTGASLLVEALGQSRAIWDANVRPKAIKETFLNTLAEMASNTKLYQLVTPEKTWDRVNIVGYHISRSVEQPHTMLFVDVRFVEVRSAKVETRKATKKPNGAAKVDNGVTTPIPVAS